MVKDETLMEVGEETLILEREREDLPRVSLPLHSQRVKLVKSCQTFQILVNAG